MHFIIIALAFVCLSAAQTTTSLFIPGADTQPLVAHVIGSDTIATTYAVECVPGTDASDCGFDGVFTLTEGPSTVAYTLSMGYENGSTSVLAFTGYIDCTLTGSPATSGVCTESFGGDEANFPGMSTITLESSDITYMPVTISDFELTNTGLASASATTASNTSAGRSTSTAKSTRSTGTGSGTGVAQSTGSTSLSKAGAAQAKATGNAQWVVGGVAVALAVL